MLWNLPLGQEEQYDRPVTEAYLPTAQAPHWFTDVRSTAVWKRPLGQPLHTVVPTVSW